MPIFECKKLEGKHFKVNGGHLCNHYSITGETYQLIIIQVIKRREDLQ